MPRRARIHIYFGTTTLPERHLDDGDDTPGHDVIEVDIGDRERVQEIELVVQPHYHQEVRGHGAADFLTGRSGPRRVNVRDKNLRDFRYRLVTLEEVDYTEGTEALPALPKPEDATLLDADVVEDDTDG